MKITYERGKVSFDLQDMLSQVKDEEKMELIESLACEDEVIYFVAQQIINKWTDSGYHGSVSRLANDIVYSGLDKAWRDVAKASGDIAKREIERLEAALTFKNEELARLRNDYSELLHSRR